jgi:hypothetical protein
LHSVFFGSRIREPKPRGFDSSIMTAVSCPRRLAFSARFGRRAPEPRARAAARTGPPSGQAVFKWYHVRLAGGAGPTFPKCQHDKHDPSKGGDPKAVCGRDHSHWGASPDPIRPARFPLLGLLLSLGCWVRAWQKPSKDPAVKTQNVVEKVSARDPARDPTTNLARKAQGVADQRCGPGQPHKVCNNRRWSRPFSPTSRQLSPGRL